FTEADARNGDLFDPHISLPIEDGRDHFLCGDLDEISHGLIITFSEPWEGWAAVLPPSTVGSSVATPMHCIICDSILNDQFQYPGGSGVMKSLRCPNRECPLTGVGRIIRHGFYQTSSR